ncbi:hypothetical protein VST7929_01000 [Vibrio stylophorae]|uniref:Lipoprotein n=1 Tax=Vibrio stylophorae TaxID=659351 RepID=A0ABN8DPM6_9VIBR|nr:hypothetical protein [Vibrio stylophorae]CAH0533139.1 hypothetical protein VST7929_01000 [Vibrio stylophorae]
MYKALFSTFTIAVLSACTPFTGTSTDYDYWQWEAGKLVQANHLTTEPTRQEIIHHALQSASVNSDLSTIIAQVATPNATPVTIELGHEPALYDTVNEMVIWHVWLVFQTDDAVSPYRCGIDFFMRDDNRQAIAETFRLYGSC